MGKHYFIKITSIIFCGLFLALFSSCEKGEVTEEVSAEDQYIARDIEFEVQVDGKEWKAKSVEYNITGLKGAHTEDGQEHGSVFFRIAAFNKKVDRQEQPIDDSALEKIQIDFDIPYVGSPYTSPNFGKGDIILLNNPSEIKEIAQYQEKDHKLFLHNPQMGASPGKITITKLILIDPNHNSSNFDSSRIEGTFNLELYPKDMPIVITPKIVTGKFSLKIGHWNFAE